MQSVRVNTALVVAVALATALLTIIQWGVLSHVVAAVFIHHAALADLTMPLLLLLTLTILRACSSGLGDAAAEWGAGRAISQIRQRLYVHIAQLGPTFLSSPQGSDLVTPVIDGVDRLDPYLSRYLPQRFLAGLVPLVILVIVFSQDLLSGVILLGTAPLIPLLMILVGSYAREQMEAQWQTLSRLSAMLLDAIQGLPTLVLYRRGAAATTRVEALSDEFRQRTMRVLRFAFMNSLVLEFMTTASIALVAVELGTRLLAGTITFESAFWILLLSPEYFRPLRDLGSYRHAAMEGATAAESIDALLAIQPPRPVSGPAHDLPAAPLGLSFNAVSFRYGDAPRLALSAIDLQIRAGTRLALVGPSGSGKSTLINLLLGYIVPTSGQIMVNGRDLASLDPDAWRRLVAYVPQRPYLFYGSVRENIALGQPEASDEAICQAADQAGAAAFIAALPQGYDTLIGERGARLSGGQVQRLALARAFLKDAPLVILDEPTANLDPESERSLRLALERLASGRSMLVVAHRLNTVYTADRILVLDEGHLVQTGPHDELCAHDGLYRRLVLAGQR